MAQLISVMAQLIADDNEDIKISDRSTNEILPKLLSNIFTPLVVSQKQQILATMDENNLLVLRNLELA